MQPSKGTESGLPTVNTFSYKYQNPLQPSNARLNGHIDTNGLCVYIMVGNMPKFVSIPEKIKADDIENSKKLHLNCQTTDDIEIAGKKALGTLSKF